MTTTKRLFVRSHDTQLRGLAPLDDSPPAPEVLDSADFGGIGKANIYPPPGRGAVVMVNALSLLEGDVVTLYWHDPRVPADSQPVAPGSNGSMKFDVPADLLRVVPPFPPVGGNTGDNATVNVWYTIYRPVFEETFVSASATVTVDWLVPGNPDPDPTTPYVNENLAPLNLPSPVPPNDLTLSVPRWANAATGDRLFISWGTSQFLAATLADKLGNSGPPVEVTIPWQTINTEGDKPVVTYYILDAVSNHSLWAPSITADVETGNRLPAPAILDLDDYDQLDADALAGSPGRVNVRYTDPTAGDVIKLTWTGRTQQGIALPDLTLEFTMPSSPTPNHTFAVPYVNVRALIGGTARTSYTVTSVDGTVRPSLSAIADVVGTALSLPAPSVREAVGDVIDPSGTATVVVRTDYSFMRPTDRINLVWQGTPVAGSPVTEQQSKLADEAIGNELSFSIPADKLLAVAGGAVAVSYTVLAAGDLPVVSDSLSLKVSDLVADEVTLAAPGVDGVSGTQLDMQNAADPIIVRVLPNPAFNPATDTVDIAWIGNAGSLISGQSRAARPAGVVFEVPRSVALADVGSSVTIYYSFVRAGTPGRLSPPRLLSLTDSGSLPAPSVAQASGGVLDALALSGDTFTMRVPMGADVLDTDSVTATVAGVGGTGSYTTSPEIGAKGMTFTLPAASLATHLGQTVQIFYTRTRTNVATVSDLLELRILAASDSEATLPTPAIAQATANGTALDLSTFSGDATVTVEPWPLMAAGQRVWLRASGATETGSTTSQPLRVGSPVTTAELTGGLSAALPRTFLATLGHQSTLAITCGVTYDQTSVEANAAKFPDARFTLKGAPPLSIDSKLMQLKVGAKEPRTADGGKPPYRYESNYPPVAAVDASTGEVTGVSKGDTYIKVRDAAGGNAWYDVKVTADPLSVDTTVMNLKVGGKDERKATGGQPPYVYRSNYTPVATVDPVTGAVTGAGPGETYIDIKDQSSGYAKYTVKVEGTLTIGGELMELKVGATQRRTATGGKPPYRYESNYPPVAAVDASTGEVTGVSKGDTYIKVRDAAGGNAWYDVKVTADPLSVDTTVMNLKVGGKDQREAKGGQPPYVYRSNYTPVATVDPVTGAVTGAGPGETYIDIKDQSSGYAKYTVKVESTLTIGGELMELKVGASQRRTASGGVPPYKYESSYPEGARVDSSGTVTGMRDCQTRIKVSDQAGGYTEYPVRVLTDPLTIGQGTMYLKVGGRDSRVAQGGIPPYRYTSNYPDGVAVDSKTGLVTGIKACTTYVEVEDEGKAYAKYTVVVTSKGAS